MELRTLRYFLEVARERNVTRAAANLHVSQPSLSKQLKDLERELGSRLFVRNNYGITLTDEGVRLRRRAEEIVGLVERTEQEMRGPDGAMGGDVHIGCGESELMRQIAQCAAAVQERDPYVKFHLHSGNREDLTDRLETGVFDFAVLVGDADPARFNALRLPGEDTWGVIMPADSVLAEHDAIRPDDLINLPLIISQQALRGENARWFGERAERLNIVATYNLGYNAAQLVRERMGYLVAFDRLIDTRPGSDLVFRPLEPQLVSPMHVVWKRHREFSHAAQLMLEELHRAFA